MKMFVKCAALSVLSLVAARAQETAIQADKFVDSTGVNIHLTYTATPYYTNWPLIRDSIVKLGVRHVRDGMGYTASTYYDRLNELGSLGIKGEFTTNGSETATALQQWPSTVLSSFEGYENINEADLTSNYVSVLKTEVPFLYTNTRASVVPNATIIGPSLTNTSSYATLGNMSAYFDYGNLHNYFGGRNPGTAGWTPAGYGSIPFALKYEKYVAGTKPVITTETGYVNSNEHATWVPEDVMGVYMPRLYLEQLRGGISRTYVYELLSEGNEDFGFMREDTSYKSAFFAVSNLLNLLSDRGASFTPGSLTYTLTGGDSTLHHLLMQKRNGDFYLALWVEKPMYDVNPHTYITVPPQSVTLNTSQSFASATVYQLDITGAMSATNLAVSTAMPLTVSDKVMVVKLAKTASSTSKWTLSAGASPSVGGRVIITPPAVNNQYDLNSTAMLTAVPSSGYAFDHFAGAVNSTTLYTSVTSATASTVSETAYFHCSYTPSATTSTFTGTGGTNTLTYTTGSGCAGTPVSSASWLTAAASNGTLTFTAQPNSNVTRAATITLGDAVITVTEDTTAATWKLNAGVSPAGAGIITSNPATIDYKFLPNTTVQLTATANPGYVFQQFSGVVKATTPTVAITSKVVTSMTETAVFTCDYNLAFSSLNVPATAVNRTQAYVTGAGCTSTPTVSASWLTATAANGYLSVNVAANTGAERVGTVTLGDATLVLTQAGTNNSTWSLTTAASPAAGGRVTANPASSTGTYPAGSYVTLTATPNTGYIFTGYTGTTASTNAVLSVTATTAATETANFRCTYTPSVTTMTPAAAGGSSTATYTTGSGCSATPTSSASWLSATASNGTLLVVTQANTGASRTATITLGDATIAVQQAGQGGFKINLSVSPANGGTVVTNPASSSYTFDAGTTVTLTAVPSAGYVFSQYTGAFPSTSAALTIAPRASATLVAVFRCTYALASASSSVATGGGSATVAYTTGSGCSTAPISSASWLSASAANGVLTVNAQANTGGPRSGVITLGDASLTVTQSASGPVTVTFASNVSGSTINLDGKPYPITSSLRWQPGDTHVLNVPAQKINGVVYVFSAWFSGTSGAGTQQVTVPGANVTYGIQLATAMPLFSAASTGGSILYSDAGSIYGGAAYYHSMESVVLTAVPASGCTFLQWSGSVVSTNPSLTLTMDAAKTELAKFSCS